MMKKPIVTLPLKVIFYGLAIILYYYYNYKSGHAVQSNDFRDITNEQQV